jgi:NAD(P)H-flavin reductase
MLILVHSSIGKITIYYYTATFIEILLSKSIREGVDNLSIGVSTRDGWKREKQKVSMGAG